MEPERYRPFNRRGRELELAARPLLVLSGCQRAGNHNNKTKTHLHRFLYTTPAVNRWRGPNRQDQPADGSRFSAARVKAPPLRHSCRP